MEKILKYLNLLEANNNREWFHLHKADRDEANKIFEDLIQDFIVSIGKNDESILNNVPKELTFKLVRDTRFSNNKLPYNPCFRAHISSKGKLPIPVGYFLYIMPNNRTFIGGGLFADVFKDATIMIRNYIDKNGEEFNKIINNENFKKYFEVKGEKLKNVPQGYSNDKSWSEYLKFKSWYIEYFFKDEELLDKNFIIKATEIFNAMKPFNDFINKALANFIFPERP